MRTPQSLCGCGGEEFLEMSQWRTPAMQGSSAQRIRIPLRGGWWICIQAPQILSGFITLICKCFLQYMWSYCEIIHRNTSPITSLKFLYFNQATQRTLGQPGQLCSAPGFFQSKTEGWISVRFYVSNKCNWCNWFIINQQGNKAQTQVENKTKNQVMRCRAMSYVTCTTYFWSCLPLNHSTWPGPKEPGAIRTKRPRPSRFLFWY